MFELVRAAEDTFYIDCPSKIGIYRTDESHVVLIDSGNDKDAAKKTLKIANENGWTITAVYHTHAHADHIGGNAVLQKQTNCAIYAPGAECAFTQSPILEPSFLYGAVPPVALRHKFLLAQPSDARPLTREALPEGLTAFSLPGHSFDMVGYRTKDDVVFLADCLSSEATLQKYAISFVYDVGQSIRTLEEVAQMQAHLFVPSHAMPCEDIAPLARINIDHIRRVSETIAELCRAPKTFDALLKAVFDHYGLKMDFVQHALLSAAVHAYLTYLQEEQAVEACIDNNAVYWAKR